MCWATRTGQHVRNIIEKDDRETRRRQQQPAPKNLAVSQAGMADDDGIDLALNSMGGNLFNHATGKHLRQNEQERKGKLERERAWPVIKDHDFALASMGGSDQSHDPEYDFALAGMGAMDCEVIKSEESGMYDEDDSTRRRRERVTPTEAIEQVVKSHMDKIKVAIRKREAAPVKKAVLNVKELTEAEASYISIVKRGANRIPFRVLKSEDGKAKLVTVTKDVATPLSPRRSKVDFVAVFGPARALHSISHFR